MSENSNNPFSMGQIIADLYMADAAIRKAETLSSKAGKFFRGLAGYHLQQAAEKLIKIQIYDSGIEINNAKMYRHSLDDLMAYAESMGIELLVPKWVNTKKYVITSWEAEGRYDLHFVVRMDTLKRCYEELDQWRKDLVNSKKR